MSDLKKYILNRPFRAPKHGTKDNEELIFKEFKVGEICNAYYVEAEQKDDKNKLRFIPIVLTEDNFIIPFSAVNELDENGLIIEKKDEEAKNPKTAKKKAEPIIVDKKGESIQNSFQDEKTKPISQKPDAVKTIVKQSKKSVNGMIIGGGIGLGYAYFTNKNMWWGLAIGVVAGGILGSMFKGSVKQKENKLDKFLQEEIKK